MIRTLLLSGLLAFAAATSFQTEDDVIVLTEETFADAIAAHDPLLVEFYAPWCGHCKKLAPEYAEAAAALKAEDPPLYIAKVDATEEGDLGTEYGVRGFPTLKLFQGGQVIDYEGGRTADDITAFMIKRAGPACKSVSTVEEAQTVIDSLDVSIIGFVSSEDSDEAKNLQKVALGQDDVACAVTTSADVAAHFETAIGSIVLFKDFDEGRVNVAGTDEETITSTIVANLLPSVIKFDQGLGRKLFGGPVKTHLLVFVDDEADYFEGIHSALSESSQSHRGDVLHIYVPASEDRVMSYFGFTAEDLPAAMLVNMADDAGMKKFQFTGEDITAEALSAFCADYMSGALKPFLKTAEPEDDSDDHVKTIVGSQFEERVMNSDQDVLLEFYAPWCGHCKQLAPKYDELAEDFSGIDHIMIAKMDATANEIDHPKVNVKGFPTIVFFPASDKANPVVYEEARDVEGFTAFLRNSATQSFELDGQAGGPDARDEL